MDQEEPTLEEKRAALMQYAENYTAHAYFELNDGRAHEGYLLEVGETAILFEWAVSPFDEGFVHEPFEIPIMDISIRSFR